MRMSADEQWAQIQAQREIEDWLRERSEERVTAEYQVKAVGILTYCVNDLEGITDGERGLLREMLIAATSNTMALWGAVNLNRMETVRVLFEKIKCLIASNTA